MANRNVVLGRLLCVIALLALATRLPLTRPVAVEAAVSRVDGYAGVVDGWRSWYGSYAMGELGAAWCIDHGIRAPDPDLAYVPVAIDQPPLDVQRGMAWILGAHGRSPDRVTSAALMLALHDLMGAVYPSGRLDVDALSVERMAGFAGDEAAVLARARELKAEARRRGQLAAPFTLGATLSPPRPQPGDTGTLELRLTDAAGLGVDGVLLHAAVTGAVLTGPVEAVTDGDGSLRLPFRAVSGDNRFVVTGTVPDLALQVFAPTVRPAQRVARPAVVEVRAEAGFAAIEQRTLTIVKRGDAEAYLPVEGARFEVRGDGRSRVGTVTIGRDGRARVTLPAGRYEIHEVAPPSGYERAGPWTVDLTARDSVLEIVNEAQRGAASMSKVDAVTGEAVAGAELVVDYDADADGQHESEVARLTSTDGPSAIDELLPGSYVVREVQTPAGYAGAEPVAFSIAPGETAVVSVANVPLSTVAFQKVAGGLHDPDAVSFDGATFDVEGVGTCVTDAAGHCELPRQSLTGGDEYCWSETRAPVGWDQAEGSCFVASAEPDGVETITVREPSRYAVVAGIKTDAATGAALAGAVYDLYRVDDAALGPAPARRAPVATVEVAELAGHTWVGHAESAADGSLRWPPQIAGFRYCAYERTAPPGYVPSTELVCTAAAIDGHGASLALANRPVPIPVARVDEVSPVVLQVPAPRSAPAAPLPSPSPSPPLAATGLDAIRLAMIATALVLAGLFLRNLRQ